MEKPSGAGAAIVLRLPAVTNPLPDRDLTDET